MAYPAYYIKEFQKALKAAGFDPGEADGYFGGATSSAAAGAIKELVKLRAAGPSTGGFTSADRAVLSRLEAGQQKEETDMANFAATYKDENARLIARIESQTQSNTSLVAIIQTFVNQLHELSDDPDSERVDALADAWEASLDAAVAAAAANTPAATEPPPEVIVPPVEEAPVEE